MGEDFPQQFFFELAQWRAADVNPFRLPPGGVSSTLFFYNSPVMNGVDREENLNGRSNECRTVTSG